MKQILTLFILFTLTFSFAQLSVSNSNYLFSNDVVLFAEDDVNLENADSYIYLRNDAQLIQGNGTTGNSGVGKLSTYQNGTVHNYAYNYWCSPVGNTTADDNLNRDFTPNNVIYDVTSAPITSSLATYTNNVNGTSTPLVISNRWLYSYDPGTVYSEWDFIGQSGTLSSGYGFTMKGTSGSGNNQLYDFRGKPNNGTISCNVLNNELTLVGNPYPSALDAVDFIHDATNASSITGTLYYWEHDLTVASHNVASYVGGYATYTIAADGTGESFVDATFDTYNADGSFNSTGASSTNGKNTYRYIPIGQGFMVEGVANGTVRTTNDHREYYKQSNTNSEFFRSSNNSMRNSNETTPELIYDENGLQILPSEYKRFRINIDFNDIYTRQILQNFHASATNGFDYGLESKSPIDAPTDVHWVLNEVPYITQAFNFDPDLTIPLVVKLDTQHSLRFRMFDIQNFDENQSIFLHDKEKNTYYDLTRINFQTNLEAGIYNDRFEITFKNGERIDELELDNNVQQYFGFFQNNTTSQLIIQNPEQKDIIELNLFDVNGKLLINEKSIKNNQIYNISTKSLSTGTYIVALTTEEETITKKIIIQN